MDDTTTRNEPGLAPGLPANAALFVDFDGLLANLSHDSANYALGAPWLFGLLVGLRGRCGGALALVTGRPLSTVDRLLSPVLLAGIGLHGAELRLRFNQPGVVEHLPSRRLAQAMQTLLTVEPFSGRRPVFVGNEPHAAAAAEVVAQFGGFGVSLQHGLGPLRSWLRDRPARERRAVPRPRLPAGVLHAPPPGGFLRRDE